MWNPFSARDDDPTNTPPPEATAPDALAPDAARHIRSDIADIEMVGTVAVATLLTAELAQDEGAEQLACLLMELAETGARHFVLDVQNVQFMDTTCLGCLVQALNRLATCGGQIAVASPNHSVNYVFKLTRLDRVFRLCPDVMSAIEAVEPKREAG